MTENPHDDVTLTARDIATMEAYAPETAKRGYAVGDTTTRGTRDCLYRVAEAAKAKAKAAKEAAKNDRLSQLERRMAAVEKALGPHGHSLIDVITEALGASLAKYVPQAVRSEINRQCCMKFQGVWSQETEFQRGDVVTDANSLWCAIVESKAQRPGSGSTAWRLIAKAGSAGHEGK